MNRIRQFERMIGGRWTGVVFHRNGAMKDPNQNQRPMRFCEAVRDSAMKPLTLTKECVNCAGALRSFGWDGGRDEELAENMTQTQKIGLESANSLIEKTPRLNGDVSSISIGDLDSPDIIISYLQPETAMNFIYQWQKKYAEKIDTKLSSIMSVCGSVAAGAYVRDEIRLSFGCPESRKYGDIGRDRLVIGVPFRMAERFIKD